MLFVLTFSSDMGNPIPENDNVADFIVDLTYIKEDQDNQPYLNDDESHHAKMESDSTLDADRFSQNHRISKVMDNGLLSPPDQFEYCSNPKRFNSTHTLPSMPDTDASSISGRHQILHDALIISYRLVFIDLTI
jgi:hypothetical protein